MHRIVLTAIFATFIAAPVSAQSGFLLTPFAGVTFDTPAAEGNRAVYGGAVGFLGPVVGFELDFGYAPNFHRADDQFLDFDADGSVTSLMGNVLVALPLAKVRPYFAAGAGLLRSNLRFGDFFQDVSRNDLGVNVGGGVMIFLGETVAIRGDVRHFRGVNVDDDIGFPDPGDFSFGGLRFWRGTAGLTFAF
jgi:hypothetical protein